MFEIYTIDLILATLLIVLVTIILWGSIYKNRKEIKIMACMVYSILSYIVFYILYKDDYEYYHEVNILVFLCLIPMSIVALVMVSWWIIPLRKLLNELKKSKSTTLHIKKELK